MQREERKDISIERDYPWLVYGDGYMAKITDMVAVKNQNGDSWKMKLIPIPHLIKAHNIGIEMVNPDQSIEVDYPIEMVKTLSSDPSFQVYFCYLNFWGQDTPATEFLKGKLNADRLLELQRENNRLRAENAYLTEKYEKSKTNALKFLREDVIAFYNEVGMNLPQQIQDNPNQIPGFVRTEQ